jgi:hypothetical protein
VGRWEDLQGWVELVDKEGEGNRETIEKRFDRITDGRAGK